VKELEVGQIGIDSGRHNDLTNLSLKNAGKGSIGKEKET
jgi:hypothetical protein